MKRSLRLAIGGALTAWVLALAPAARADVRCSTLGIDINCPSGLSE